MAKRPYTKKSDYWNNKSADKPPVVIESSDFEPMTFGESFAARAETSADRSSQRRNRVSTGGMSKEFSSISELSLPYAEDKNGIGIRETVLLTQLAYANIAIFKNSIDLMSEFSNSDIYFEGGSKAARMFFEQWLKVIRIDKVSRQYFLEYYRSSNVFIYRFNGKLSTKSSKKISKYFSNKEKMSIEIPTRYAFLNPVDIISLSTSTFSKNGAIYVKALSQYELASLKDPKNEADREIFESLPTETRKKIKDANFNKDGVVITLDPSRLITSFSKKQDYEPFAVPFGYPVLRDINAKLELKKFDQAVSRAVENVILLITMGAKPEDGGINQNNLAAMREMFKNESVGRVLISDYTTKADFIIPDISKVVGPEKYQILNEDIKEGLQNIITSSDKYAATQVKAQLFMERLNEARESFLNDFLVPEMEEIARTIGLQGIPKVKFSEKSLKDEVQFARAVTRLIELGVIHPDEGIKAINTGYISHDETIRGEYKVLSKKDRDAGYYDPIIGGGNKDDKLGAKKVGAKKPIKKETGRPTGSKASEIEDENLEQVSVASIQDAFQKASNLLTYIEKTYSSVGGSVKNNKDILQSLCESVICSEELCNWESVAEDCVKNPNAISKLTTIDEVLNTSAKMDLNTYASAILYHAKKL